MGRQDKGDRQWVSGAGGRALSPLLSRPMLLTLTLTQPHAVGASPSFACYFFLFLFPCALSRFHPPRPTCILLLGRGERLGVCGIGGRAFFSSPTVFLQADFISLSPSPLVPRPPDPPSSTPGRVVEVRRQVRRRRPVRVRLPGQHRIGCTQWCVRLDVKSRMHLIASLIKCSSTSNTLVFSPTTIQPQNILLFVHISQTTQNFHASPHFERASEACARSIDGCFGRDRSLLRVCPCLGCTWPP